MGTILRARFEAPGRIEESTDGRESWHDVTEREAKRAAAPAAQKPLTLAEWQAEGVRRFGEDKKQWRFVCPACKHVARVQDWLGAGAGQGAIGFSCVGRSLQGKVREAFEGKGKGPCNYAGGGLFKLNPVLVDDGQGNVQSFFAFAEVPAA